MYSDEVADLFELLICAMRDLAARGEQAEDPAENAKTLSRVADTLGLHALLLCSERGRDVIADCAVRLQETAQEHGIDFSVDFADRAGPEDHDAVVSWRELQIAEAAHDRACNPDSQAIAPQEQMRRYALRLVAVAGSIADENEDWRPHTDLMLFALRLVSAAKEELSDRPVPRNASQLDSALGEETSPYSSF